MCMYVYTCVYVYTCACMYYTCGGYRTILGVRLRTVNCSFEAGFLNGLEIATWANWLTREPLGFCLCLSGHLMVHKESAYVLCCEAQIHTFMLVRQTLH